MFDLLWYIILTFLKISTTVVNRMRCKLYFISWHLIFSKTNMNITLIYQRSDEGSKFTPRCYSKNGQRKGRDGNHFFQRTKYFVKTLSFRKKTNKIKKNDLKSFKRNWKKRVFFCTNDLWNKIFNKRSFFTEQTIFSLFRTNLWKNTFFTERSILPSEKTNEIDKK